MTRSRLKTKARIKRASRHARDNASKLDKQALDELEAIYKDGLSRLQARISAYGDASGSLRLSSLQGLKQALEYTHSELERIQQTALFERMEEVAAMGIEPMAELLGAERVARLVNASVKQARDFVDAGGLQLSDRLWRVNNHAREVVAQAVQSAIIQGDSASAAAQEFLSNGVPVPAALQQKIGRANTAAVNRVVAKALMTDENNPYNNAKRIFRTEINRAHGQAYQAAVFEHDDAMGTRFLLSPNHREVDICDMHAKANVYGLGPGVYPKGKNPWPAHPNTISYVEVVFVDEVSDADKAGKQSRTEWLADKQPHIQAKVLNSRRKQAAFVNGHLKESQFATPWYVLKRRYDKRGIDISQTTGAVVKRPTASGAVNPFDVPALAPMSKSDAERHIKTHFAYRVDLEGINTQAMNSVANGLNAVLGKYGLFIGKMDWIERGRAKGAAAFYSRPISGWEPVKDRIAIRKKYVKTDAAREREKNLVYLTQKQQRLDNFDKRIAATNNAQQKQRFIEARRYVEAATRWGVSEVVDDPVFSVIAHEAGHALVAQGVGILPRWHAALQKYKVERIDWFRVSEYAGTDTTAEELFAEVTALMADGLDNLMPNNVRAAYIETLENYRRK